MCRKKATEMRAQGARSVSRLQIRLSWKNKIGPRLKSLPRIVLTQIEIIGKGTSILLDATAL